MTTTRDAPSVIEKLTGVRQHELAGEPTVEALEASGTSPPCGGATSASGTPTDPRDQTAPDPRIAHHARLNPTTPSILPPEVGRFRTAIIDAVGGDIDRFTYIDRDSCIGACPMCDAALAVRFHGTAARADLTCHGGCDEQAIADAIRGLVRR
jgi:hypothetical protein